MIFSQKRGTPDHIKTWDIVITGRRLCFIVFLLMNLVLFLSRLFQRALANDTFSCLRVDQIIFARDELCTKSVIVFIRRAVVGIFNQIILSLEMTLGSILVCRDVKEFIIEIVVTDE
ncbi:hypothetical protein [Nisaea sediminum]|uniref:hypothetical protein n=1 Tax=Nisaea sediminum TaxID=2775867 RepID=UPI001D03303B|nr:hypothetical protein [Nisaea sediminum]